MNDYVALANYLALAAWSRSLDCVVVDAESLRKYFSLERLPDSRVTKLVSTAKPLFKYSEKLWANPDQNANVSLYLSRRKLPAAVFRGGVMPTLQRIELLSLTVPTEQVALPRRADLLRQLNLVGSGAAVFKLVAKS